MSIQAKEILSSLEKYIQGLDLSLSIDEIGTVISTADGIARVIGIEDVEVDEVVRFESGARGIALNLEHNCTSVVLLEGEDLVKQGDKVFREKSSLQAPVGEAVLGRVLNALGEPIDGKGPIGNTEFNEISTKAPDIISRQSVKEPLYTGIKAIDALIPIGKGQRELIIGDRQIGKTAIAIDTIINQKHTHLTEQPVYCIYVAIGQKCSSLAYIQKKLEEHDAMRYTVIVSTTAADTAAKQFVAPYFGCAIGESFRDNGMHALIIYDDLSKHAIAYRSMSLLLKRPPGREAYPGDVFFIHSRLLERAAKLSHDKGSGSLTALPIVETQSGDISSYIPTNIISITDGQIYLSEDLFSKGVRPAINIGLSVSRVGSTAQEKAMRQVAGKLKLELAQFKELQSFATFSSDLNESTKEILEKGEKLMESMKQEQYKPLSMPEQVISIYAQIKNHVKYVQAIKIGEYQDELLNYIKSNYPHVIESVKNNKEITEEIEALLEEILPVFTQIFLQKK
jgi:F-type H+-transporting ATPase subunit alpha